MARQYSCTFKQWLRRGGGISRLTPARGLKDRFRGSRLFLLVSCCLLPIASAAQADTRARQREKAGELVREAMHREIYGLSDERERLLNEALTLDRSCDGSLAAGADRRARALAPADEVQEPAWLRKKREVYEQLRSKTPLTAPGQLSLRIGAATRHATAGEVAT